MLAPECAWRQFGWPIHRLGDLVHPRSLKDIGLIWWFNVKMMNSRLFFNPQVLVFKRLLIVSLGCLFSFGCEPISDSAPVLAAPTAAETAPVGNFRSVPLDDLTVAPAWLFPQRRLIEGGELILHAPQIREWPDFETTSAQLAFEYLPQSTSSPEFGTLTFTGTTEVDLDARVVQIEAIKVSEVVFAGDVADSHSDAILNAATRERLTAPLDLFLSYLAADVLEFPTTQGFNTQPPEIYVTETSTILLFVNGEPVFAPLANSGVSAVANANWPLFRDDATTLLYLLNRDVWQSAPELDGPWTAADKLPDSFLQIPEAELQAAVREAMPLVLTEEAIPAVLVVSEPTELIVTDGEPETIEIEGTDGLAYVANTESPLFILDGTWYFLASGRWFASDALIEGEWRYVEQLPDAFQSIPKDHEQADVLASVPGTSEARVASLEVILPVKKEASLDAQAPEVAYAGEPQFVPITATEVARAANTSYDILEYKGRYYLCYAGIWYAASTPIGPWAVTADVPAAIYTIPPSSASYHVTHVKVYASTPTTVIYTYPPSYTTSVYVVAGVPVYGTGWYYPPYVYGAAYYPYHTSYGHGSWYNPNTGTYGSRSVAYGPYGGYSYTEGYNPNTGRYGYVETAWDNDEWASFGETYNPRTGVGTETSRHYDEHHNIMKTEREISRGDRSLSTDRKVDYDTGIADVNRQTGSGASSQARRTLDDGTLSSQGTITAADGRTANFSGEYDRDGGSTSITGSDGGTGTIERDGNRSNASREGSFSRDGETVNTETQRRGNTTVSTFESSGGGQATSTSKGLGRTTVGESAGGDLYAGHDGNVYKKTDSGWSTYEGGDWQQMDTPERATDSRSANSRSEAQGTRSGSGNYTRSADSSTNRSTRSTSSASLNRDYSSRQSGYSRNSQRSSSSRYSRRSSSRSGGGRSRRR